jgi:pimeloyl-ACP methyl ester carboxylesterase/class 3 adenylate cyclase
MRDPIDIRYARNGEIALGYTVIGEGPLDLVYVPAFGGLEVMNESRPYAAFLSRLSSFARVIVVDRRGQGVSDRYAPTDLPTLEDLVDDLVAVLDDVGSERAVLLGYSDAGAQCAMCAATYPDRVLGLILYAVAARGTQAPDYPWQWSEAEWEEYLAGATAWGTLDYAVESMPLFAPSYVGNAEQLAWWVRQMRVATSPGAQLAQELVFRDTDIRDLLPAIGVPTLVMHRTNDRVEPVGAGRYVADRIPAAQFVELEGGDHWPWAGDQSALIEEVRTFAQSVERDNEAAATRVLASVLFTDIVDSTAQAAALGDRRWGELRGLHDRIVRNQLARHRGTEIKTMGDGFLATFDGPARAVRCALAICEGEKAIGIEVRAGLHTGEVELESGDIAGLAVALGARVGALAGPGEVLVSSTVKDLVVGSGLAFDDRGEHELKGVPGSWRLYTALGEVDHSRSEPFSGQRASV